MSSFDKITAALQYQEQGYSFEEIAKFLDYKHKYSLYGAINYLGGKVVDGKSLQIQMI